MKLMSVHVGMDHWVEFVLVNLPRLSVKSKFIHIKQAVLVLALSLVIFQTLILILILILAPSLTPSLTPNLTPHILLYEVYLIISTLI